MTLQEIKKLNREEKYKFLPGLPELQVIKLVRRAHSAQKCSHGGNCLSEKEMIKLVGEFIRNLISLCETRLLKGVVEELSKIEKWPEPSPNTGKGGPGPLWTSGLLTQYKHDKERHEKEISDLKQSLTKEIK